MKLSSLATARRNLFVYSGDVKRLLLGAGSVIFITILLSTNLVPDRVNLHVGEVAPEEVRAPRTAEYENRAETERLRLRAMQLVNPRYYRVEFASQDALKTVDEVFEHVLSAQVEGRSVEHQADVIRQSCGVSLSPEAVKALIHAPIETINDLRAKLHQVVGRAMDREVHNRPDDLPALRTQVVEDVAKLNVPKQYLPALAQIAKASVRYNRLYDADSTERARRDEALKVAPVSWTVMKGEVIIRKGEVVTRQHIDKLTALGLMHPEMDFSRVAFVAVLVIVLIQLVALYVARYHPPIYSDIKRMGLLALIVVTCVVGMKVGQSALDLKASGVLAGYLGMLWVSTAAMLIAVLVHPNVACLVAAVLAAGIGASMDMELQYVTAAVLSGVVGVYAVARIVDRGSLVRLALAMAGTNTGLLWVLSGVAGQGWQVETAPAAAWGFGSGIGAALLFWLGVAVLERPFGIITHVGLLELSDPNRPILRRLLMEAPGTYHHSMVVGNLAERAAESIGADSMLVRAQAYYHDIGKMRRPQFFIENQRVENVHDRLSPSLSMLVVAAHVREGVEIALEHRLPPRIVDGIREHHGTSLVSFFYHQACAEQEPSSVLEQHFRYDGPKPRSKETAVLMLADSVEAASRSLVKPTPSKIEGMVYRIIQARLQDGQLDESDLTFRDIEKIASSFTRTLCGMLHARVEYPDVVAVQSKKALLNVANDLRPCPPEGEPKAASGPDEEAVAI